MVMTDNLNSKRFSPSDDLARPAADSNPIPTARHLALLDLLRGVAILLVFLCHCPPALPPRLDEAYHFPWDFTAALFSGKVSLSELALWPLFAVGQLGELGLAIFFVVSGFCIYQTYTQTTRPEARVFFVRRFFRIYPPYLLTLLILLLVFPLTRLSFTRLSDWAQIVTHLLMCHNLSSTYVDSINPVFWSLAVEIQLYLLFPLSLIWVRRASYGRVLPLLAGIEITVRSVALFGFAIPHHTTPAWVWAWPYVFWFSWSTGAAIADAHFNRRPLPFVRIHPLVWLGAGLMDTLVLTGQFSFTFFALFTASLIARSLRSMRSEAKESWPLNFVRRIGIYSRKRLQIDRESR